MHLIWDFVKSRIISIIFQHENGAELALGFAKNNVYEAVSYMIFEMESVSDKN